MITFIVGLIVLLISVGAIILRSSISSEPVYSVLGGLLGFVLGLVFVVASTAIYVKDNEGGLITIKIGGGQLPSGSIIAANGENGPQAEVLSPGWHFFYWPWVYDLVSIPNMDIPSGQVGVVKAHDGKPLPDGEVYAPIWEKPEEMLSGEKFLTGNGFRGPQLTVLPPGQYRYNPRLFNITLQPAITVKIGEVAVVKANAGKEYEGTESEMVNGVPIVPNGFRGIWKKALIPNQYYMHPDAYEIIRVKTVNRIYSYTGSSRADQTDNSINVRTKDGFEFPVDIRASAKISAEDAPYVVAILANPDDDANKDGFDTLEEIVVLPAVRTIFRNSAEGRGALEYVNTRSDIEKTSSAIFTSRLKEFKVNTDGLFLADIGLSKTPEGKGLLTTQTQKEVAKQETETWLQKKLAQEARAESVKAEKEADKEADKVDAKVSIEIAKDKAQAAIEEATGKAEAAKKQIEAVGGFGNYIFSRAIDSVTERWKGELPGVLVIGGSGDGAETAFISKLLKDMTNKPPTK